MTTYQDYLNGTAELIGRNAQEGFHEVNLLGRSFTVLPGVFSPKHFLDTEYFAQEVTKRIRDDENFLEIGPGTGIISVLAALRGANVTAVDNNPRAVENTRSNAVRHGVNPEVYCGDLYQPLGEQRYDTIFWNTPFGLVSERQLTDLERAVFDPGYQATRRFIEEAPAHLTAQGRLLIGFSDTLGKPELLRQYLDANGFTYHKIGSKQSEEVHPVTWDLYEAHQRFTATIPPSELIF